MVDYVHLNSSTDYEYHNITNDRLKFPDTMMVLLRVLTVASLAVQWFTKFKGLLKRFLEMKVCVCTMRRQEKC